MTHELAAEHALTKIAIAIAAGATMFTAGAAAAAVEMLDTILA